MKNKRKTEGIEEKTIKVIIFDLVSDSEKLRQIDKEIGITLSKTQLNHLMTSRRDLLKRIYITRAEIEKRIPDPEGVDFRLFNLFCVILNSTYGRGVGESILMTFERQSGLSALEIVNYPEIFEKVTINTFGVKAAEKINGELVSHIGSEFGFHFTSKIPLKEAIRSALQSRDASTR